MTRRRFPSRIVSGGQTGVDRAALDVAITLGIDHGGWCPRGRLAEDGSIPAKYLLTETASAQYHVRTERNAVDSDATLIVHRGALRGGTALTQRLAEKHGRPLLTIDLDQHVTPESVQQWLAAARVEVLNVAGPRESTAPGIGEAAYAFLLQALSHAHGGHEASADS